MTDTHTKKLAATVEATIPINPRQVFDYLSTLENNPQWNWPVITTTPSPPDRSGPAHAISRPRLPNPTTPNLEVTHLQAPYLFEVVAAGDRLAAIYRYEFEAGDHTTTRLRIHAEVEPRHPVGRPDLYMERLEASLRASLDTLRGVLPPAEDQTSLGGATIRKENRHDGSASPCPLLHGRRHLPPQRRRRGSTSACQPSRIRGVPTMRVSAERRGLRACPLCWAPFPTPL